MGLYSDDHKLVIVTGPKNIYFHLTSKVDNNLKHETSKTQLIFSGTKNKEQD